MAQERHIRILPRLVFEIFGINNCIALYFDAGILPLCTTWSWSHLNVLSVFGNLFSTWPLCPRRTLLKESQGCTPGPFSFSFHLTSRPTGWKVNVKVAMTTGEMPSCSSWPSMAFWSSSFSTASPCSSLSSGMAMSSTSSEVVWAAIPTCQNLGWLRRLLSSSLNVPSPSPWSSFYQPV